MNNLSRLITTFVFIFSLLLPSYAEQTKVVIYGDSISAGYGMKLSQSWPSLLHNQYQNDKLPIKVINESISGETTGGGLARLDEVINRNQLNKNDWLVIELGGNDGLRGFPVKRLQSNLEQMIKKAQYQQINVAIMQIQVPPNLGKRYSTMFSATYPRLAKQYDIPLMPFFMEEIAIHEKYMQKDQLHPNVSAQVIIRDIMAPQIKELVMAVE